NRPASGMLPAHPYGHFHGSPTRSEKTTCTSAHPRRQCIARHAQTRRAVLFSAASLFEAWVTRRKSAHTQRAYREDVMSFVKFAGIGWPDQAIALYSVSVKDVLAFREHLVEKDAAPKTINRRISSVSSF